MTYRLIVNAARDIGIGPDRLPDFLNLEDDASAIELLGQDELSDDDIAAVVQQDHLRWRSRSDLEEQVTEKLLVAAARVGQHRFATSVLSNHGNRCVFCGLSILRAGRPTPRMLVASHIKPWRLSTPSERLDPLNGLTACPTHDVAFDTGLLAVNGGLRIHIQPSVERAAQLDPATRAAFGRPPLREWLVLPRDAVRPRDPYLAWHKSNVFGLYGG